MVLMVVDVPRALMDRLGMRLTVRMSPDASVPSCAVLLGTIP